MQLNANQIFAGRYKLLSKIGIGGFSEVWKVADEMAEDRIMVLKVYAPERGLDEFGIKQFRREYAITLDLNHPHLLKANHFDIADGSPYLIMPYCEHGSLYGKFMEQGTLSEREVADMLAQVAGALEYLHRKDILHQDIKPDNVLIDAEGNYLLTDFGISSRLRSTLQKSTTTAKAMTVAYAPPEKFEGSATVGPQGDVFALGVMLYELLTGDLPWSGMGGAYVHPDSSPPQLPDSISPALNKLVQLCVSHNPANRPTPNEIKQAAEEYLKTEAWGFFAKKSPTSPTAGRKTQILHDIKPEAQPSMEPVREQRHSNRTLWLGGGVVIVAAATAAIFWWTKNDQKISASTDPETETTLTILPNDTIAATTVASDDMPPTHTEPNTDDPNTHEVATVTTDAPTQKPKDNEPNTPNKQPEQPPVAYKPDIVAKEPPLASTSEVDWRDLKYFKASNGKYGYKHKKTGKTIIEPKYDNVFNYFSEGLAGVKLNDKWGFIDKTGWEIIPFKYDKAFDFSESFAAVELNSKWGFIDKTGMEAIPLKYNFADAFHEGLAAVELNSKWGFIDKTGRQVIPFKYNFANAFNEGLAAVELNSKYGFVDKTGKLVIPFIYDDAIIFFKGTAQVVLNNQWIFIDKTGKCVKDCP